MINATEVNEENALFHSIRVNGGQAITHGKDRSSCTQAGNAASQTLSQTRKTDGEGDRTERTVITERGGSGRLAKGRTKLPSKDGRRKGVSIGKATLSLSLPTSSRSPRS